MSEVTKLLRYTPLAKERFQLPWGCITLVVSLLASTGSIINAELISSNVYPDDILTPYPKGRHGSTRTARDVSECQHIVWENRTYEEFKTSTRVPSKERVHYDLLRFADVVYQGPLRRRYAVGAVAKIENPFYTFSVLEPKEKDGCKKKYFSFQKSTVQETAKQRKHGCRLATNGGFFNVHSGECLGNIVSDGRVVKSTNGIANANFGIRQDGTIVVGYVSEADIRSKTNPFRQLVSGVIWLVRNSTNYVNESMKIECSENEDTGSMNTFVEVLSARSAIGHDDMGQLVLAHIEGQTHVRGANLYEFADLLIRKGVVNAINLDGGGSSTFVQEGFLMNYPSDHCRFDSIYRCPRDVSTAVCVHDPECLDPDCSDHGSCDKGTCSCDTPWVGVSCDRVNCSLANCSGNGNCSDDKCQCDPGWTGGYCERTCPSNRYGLNCAKGCYCFGKGHCHPVYGYCICPAGLTGSGCWKECSRGRYGPNCNEQCQYPDCSGHGDCSKVTGVCHCEEGWFGASCNDSVQPLLSSPLSLYPTPTSPHFLVAPPSSSSSSSSDSALLVLPSSVLSVTELSSKQLLDSSDTLSVTHQFSPVVTHCNTSNVMVSSPSDHISSSSTVTIVIIVSLGTIIVHIVLCVFSAQCRTGMGVATARAEMRRELMERREWEHMMQQGTDWSTDSPS